VTKPYRILVTGSRDWQDQDAVHKALADTVRELPADREVIVVHGGCWAGADHIADDWAKAYGATVEVHYANWDRHKRAAGPLRNRHMVELGADLCLSFIRNRSRGASHCTHIAEQAGIPVRRWTA
jgi:hypothetical protein